MSEDRPGDRKKKAASGERTPPRKGGGTPRRPRTVREELEARAAAPKRRPRPADSGGARPSRRADESEDRGGFGPWSKGSAATEAPVPRRAGERGAPGDPAVRDVARDAIARASGRDRAALRIVHREGGAPAEQPVPRAKRPGKAAARRKSAVSTGGAGRPRKTATRVEEAVVKAARALDRGYEREAVRILRPVRELNPDNVEVRELFGVALYRLGRWPAAQKELEAYVALTASTDQHPILMDTLRAQGRHKRVEALWEELGAASPAPDVVTEGRIVAAGSLADQGKLVQAIKLLERGPVSPKRTAPHHLRLWYALADLHERAGDLPAARALFRRISSHDPAFVDVAERLAALS